MTTSIVIPTYNGADKILNVLTCLMEQTVAPDEVIVVIDGSTDNTKEILSRNNFGFNKFRIIEQKNGGRAKVRNRGAHEASSELLIFFDDDMLPENNCLQQHIIHHHQHWGSILTGSAIDVQREKCTEAQTFKTSLTLKWSQQLIQTQGQPLPADQIFLTAANFSISKQLFTLLNGFDERLTDAEDYDLALRAHKAGIPLFYNHEAFAWHDDRISFRTYIHRLRQYTRAQEMLTILKPELYAGKNKYQAPPPTGIKGCIFRFFAKKFWINQADKNSWMKLIPRNLRYRIYDVIIMTNGTFFPEKVHIS